MKRILKQRTFVLLLFLLSICSFSIGQVKTKIYHDGIPKAIINDAHSNEKIIEVIPPEIFNKLLSGDFRENANTSEYENRFAISTNLDLDVISKSKRVISQEFVTYYLSLSAEKAFNISLQFSSFSLSENSVLSIFTTNEITERITARENNAHNIWATRVYQGGKLYLMLKVPKIEDGKNQLVIDKAALGYRKVGAEFFGNPGASADCNINVVCPQGDDFRDEQNAVALLLVADGEGTCTGTLLTNTCGDNTSYVLTANHCLEGNFANWVFQYMYWSESCSPNSGWSEDIQFNGCQLRANDCALDFALVEMDQTPPQNSGITYAGWSRETNPATSGATIHHPRGDLMKISLFETTATSVPWAIPAPVNPCPSAVSNHWRVNFSEGIVQHGSSGAALFNQDGRVVGQLHGNQNNTCAVNAPNTCWCITQIPSIGEFGRFDLAWGMDAMGNFLPGRNATNSLAPWLDPGNTGVMTTNTTPMVAITGPDLLCTSETYTISNMPTGATVTGWSASPSGAVAFSGSGNSRVVTKSGGFNGEVILTAMVNTDCGSVEVERVIWAGLPDRPIYYDEMGDTVFHIETCVDLHHNVLVKNEIPHSLILEWEWELGVGNFNVVDLGGGFGTVIGFQPSSGFFSVRVRNACGWSPRTLFTVSITDCAFRSGLSVYPNPADETLSVSLGNHGHGSAGKRMVPATTFTAILYDGSGREQRRDESWDGTIQFDTAGLPEGTYFVHIHKGGEVEKRQVVIRH